jgi:hypothetical protein
MLPVALSEPAPPADASQAEPRCPRCAVALRPIALPPGAFGALADGCIDCTDGSPTKQTPWACPRCGVVYLLDAACRL